MCEYFSRRLGTNFEFKSLFTLFRRLMGCFYYPTVLALPTATGAAICQPLLSHRAIYAYAHGLSAIVNSQYYFDSRNVRFDVHTFVSPFD